ncbi:4a-hydroxytetrahydrobiopterin dehydratase [Streptomyces sp. SA15]|uniref:4a-hydroxytetrahydrobiopterin dehydratase n=1 Tax=Streptomyces sp. SA15 TaxID=934019 RepID=UPI00117D105F|nr:4a-hydroxytetrahydrobiopterin dehydratase [Streptomyces sp. SA15]
MVEVAEDVVTVGQAGGDVVAVVSGSGDRGEKPAGRLSDLLAEVAKPAGGTPEQALFLAQTVVSRVTADDISLMADLRSCLPDEFGTLFTEPDPLPERSSRATDAPRPLSDAEVPAALRQRPGWTGDTHELSRTVALPVDRVQLLLTQVERAADELGHRPLTQQTGDGVRFTVQTRSVQAVTPLDLDLADRIDDAVMAVGGGSAT